MRKISYAGYHFPPEIIHQAIWLYLRFTLSFRDVEDLLAERGIAVSYETVRRWVNHFGPTIAAHLRKRLCQSNRGRLRAARHARPQTAIYATSARHSANAAERLCL
jgi:transposase-like protein